MPPPGRWKTPSAPCARGASVFPLAKAGFRGYPAPMSRRAVALAFLLYPSFAAARETARVVEAPNLGAGVPSISAPSLNLSLTPALKTGSAALQLQLRPGLAYIAAPQQLTALPQSEIFTAQPFAMLAQEPEAGQRDEDFEAGAANARRLFDGLATKAERLENLALPVRGAPVLQSYRKTLDAAKEEGYTPARTHDVIAAAEAVFKGMGVLTERIQSKDEPGLRIAAKRGVSELNDLAADVLASMGTRLEYLPAVTSGSTALYMLRTNRVALAPLDSPDFYLALLHELRHAWYASLLDKGDVRLFHFHMYARPGMRIAPKARWYSEYMTFEELSTYPKTLKHMTAELKRASPETREAFRKSAKNRVRQYAELLQSAEYLGWMLKRLEKRMPDLLERMDAADYKKVQIRRSPDVDWFELPLPQGSFFAPAPKREKRNVIGWKTRRGAFDEAAARIALAGRLIAEMSEDVAPWVVAFDEAVDDGDWAKADALAGKMVARAAAAEKAWAAAQPKS